MSKQKHAYQVIGVVELVRAVRAAIDDLQPDSPIGARLRAALERFQTEPPPAGVEASPAERPVTHGLGYPES